MYIKSDVKPTPRINGEKLRTPIEGEPETVSPGASCSSLTSSVAFFAFFPFFLSTNSAKAQ
jgi:hypothetical protein